MFDKSLEWPGGIGLQIQSLGVPIKLGFPFDFDGFKAAERWLPRMVDEIIDNSISCVSVHAPEGPVVGFCPEGFPTRTRGIREFADKVGAVAIVFHPLRVSSTSYGECLNPLSNVIKVAQQETAATIILETFKGVPYFDYKDVLTEGLPICLDTSHMSHKEALAVVEKHHGQIWHVHLSEASNGLTHAAVRKPGMQTENEAIGQTSVG